MAALFASMAVKSALDNLSSLLPARSTSAPPSGATAVTRGIEHLRMLEPVMRTIHATLHDAGQQWNLREESAMLRVKELTELAYDAEDVVEEYEYEVSRCRVEEALESSAAVAEGGASSSEHRRRQEVQDAARKYYSTGATTGIVPVPTELVHRASKIMERFAEIKEYADSFTLSENDGERRIVPDIRTVRQTSSIVYAPRILGREEDKEQVISMLKLGSREGSYSIGSHMSVLAIVGMGGLGKTTLAQLVYNDTRVRQAFDLYAWVCVSEDFDVENITRKIITSLTWNTCHHLHAGSLQAVLADHVKEKRVFLVMDDVWNQRSDYWELLCAPLSAFRECHIVVTTRSQTVARLAQTTHIYNLNCFSPDDSWSLFKQTALVQQEIVTPTNLIETGRRITEMCKGLPLAIKTLGSILRYETDENKWRDILENELWNIKQSRDQVLPALELSYKYMPMHLKPCFVSLSLFRKNIYIDEYRVIELWKLLNLLHVDGSDNVDEIGSIYFNELMQRSLFQNYVETQRIVMHDLVHDLACLLAGGEFFRLDGGKQTELPRDARYLSILSTDKSIHVSNAPQSLRVITMMEITDVENPEVLLFNCKKLRIIDVQPGRLAKTILDVIGDMKLLRHFSLSGYEEDALPTCVYKLFNLRSLVIAAHKLRGIRHLVKLHTMPEIHFSRCGSFFNIRELRNMNEIRTLVMYGLCDVIINDADEAHLHWKKNLEILQLNFCKLEEYSIHSTVCAVQLLESLRPHHQSLKVLRLQNFNCEIYPSWLGCSSFTMLTKIVLHNCQSRHLPTLGELPSLKSLDIRIMQDVKCIGHEFCSLDPRVKGFQSLKELSFHEMYQLSEWIGVEDGEFPRLETLWIWNAFELRSLPLVPFLSLSSLLLYDCRSLMTFPASPALRELNISTCSMLTELPALPSLESLDLFCCPNVATFGHFPSLSVLQLHAPFKEETHHRLVNSHPSLERLSVWSDTLTSMNLEPQSLPSLTELVISCPNLNYCGGLVSLTSLKILNLRRSTQLQVPGSLRTQLEGLLLPLSVEWVTQSPYPKVIHPNLPIPKTVGYLMHPSKQ